jgi:DNA-binding IclR family transcriptional regulator
MVIKKNQNKSRQAESITNYPDKKGKSAVLLHKEGAQSIYRTIAILRAVAKYNDQGAGLSKIARSISLPTTTTLRILSVLVQEGLISFDPLSKVYHIGMELFILGTAAQHYSIRDRFRNALEKVAQETGETTYLVVRSGIDSQCLDRVVGKYPIQVLTFEVGERRPLGIGAGSLSIMASLPEDQAEKIISANALRYPQFRGRTVDDVRTMIAQTRKLGYGYSAGNVSPDTIGVGTAIQDHQGKVVAAMSVAGIVKRMDKKRQEEIVRLIKKEVKDTGFVSG